METTENESREKKELSDFEKWVLLAEWHGWNQLAREEETLEGRVAFRAMRDTVGEILKANHCPCIATNSNEFIPIRMDCAGVMVNFLPSDIEQMREAVARFDAQNCGGAK